MGQNVGEFLRPDLLSGDIGTAPALLSQMTVRKKLDHSALGTMLVLVEGLEANSSWDRLVDDPEDATVVSHSEFKLLLPPAKEGEFYYFLF